MTASISSHVSVPPVLVPSDPKRGPCRHGDLATVWDRGTGETHGTFLLASGEIRTHAQPFKKSLVPALISLVVMISN